MDMELIPQMPTKPTLRRWRTRLALWTKELEECKTAFALAADLSAYLGMASFLCQSFDVCRTTDQDGDGIVTKDQLVQPEMYKAIPFAQDGASEERSQYIGYFFSEGDHPDKSQVIGVRVSVSQVTLMHLNHQRCHGDAQFVYVVVDGAGAGVVHSTEYWRIHNELHGWGGRN